MYVGPPMGVHRLYGFLRDKGHDIRIIDLRIEFWRYWLSIEKLTEIVDFLSRRPRNVTEAFIREKFLKRFVTANIWAHGMLYPQVYIEPQHALAKFLMHHSAKDIADRIVAWTPQQTSELAAQVKDDMFWRFEREGDMNAFIWGCILLSLRFFPTILKPEGIFTQESPYSSEDIASVLTVPSVNPFLQFAREVVAPLVDVEQFQTIGLSVTHESELIPALTIAKEIKKLLPERRIIFGGMQVSLMAPGLARVSDLLCPVDYLVCSPVGEEPFEQLLQCRTTTDVERVPALYFHKDGRFICSNVTNTVDMNQVGRPQYPKRYRRCYNSYAIITSLHCYWRKCTFCTYTHSAQMRQMIKVTRPLRDLNLVVEDIREALSVSGEGTPNSFFYIEDSSMPPGRLLNLLYRVREAGLYIQVSAFMRFEPELLNQSEVDLNYLRDLGLRRVFMGLESGCQRVNDLMGKGVNVNMARQIVRKLHDNGIKVSLGTIIGFPTETRIEAEETLDFILSIEPYIRYVEVNPFRLEKTSAIYRDAPRYGVHLWMEDSEDLSLFSKYRLSGSIGSEDSVPICNEFNRKFLQLHSPEVDWDTIFRYADG